MALMMPGLSDLETLIRKAAIARGVSPDVAVARAKAQGLQSPDQIGELFPSNQPQRRGYDNTGGSAAPGQMHEMPNGPSASSGGGGLMGGISDFLGGLSNQDASGFLDYGGVPFGTRMTALSEAIGAGRTGRSMDPRIAGMVPAAREATRMRQMAGTLADNLQATNPVLADAIRMNPSLVEDYMKGQMDLEKSTKLEELQHGFRTKEAEMQHGWDTEGKNIDWARRQEEIKLQSDYNPQIRSIHEWQTKWKDTVDKNDWGNLSTLELYRKWTKDPNLTETEAQRMANANITLESLRDEYKSIVDDRGKKSGDVLSSISGGLEKGEYLLNPEAAAAGTEPPKVGTMEGSKREQEMKAAEAVDKNIEVNKQGVALDVVRAANDALESIDRSEKGTSMPSTGWAAYLQYAPETEAKALSNSLHTMRSNLALDKVLEIRSATKTGAGIGPPSDFEQKMLMSARTTLDQYESSTDLKRDVMYAASKYEAIVTYIKGPDGKYRSVLENDAMILRADPSATRMRKFDAIYGDGAAALALGNADAERQ